MQAWPCRLPTLHTARLRLRPFTDEDADSLFALHSNAHVLRYWDSPPWTDRARAGRFIADVPDSWPTRAPVRGWRWTASPTGPSSAGAA